MFNSVLLNELRKFTIFCFKYLLCFVTNINKSILIIHIYINTNILHCIQVVPVTHIKYSLIIFVQKILTTLYKLFSFSSISTELSLKFESYLQKTKKKEKGFGFHTNEYKYWLILLFLIYYFNVICTDLCFFTWKKRTTWKHYHDIFGSL